MLTVLALALATAAPAAAAAPAPGCQGSVFADPTESANRPEKGAYSSTSPQLDVTQGFFTYDGAGGLAVNLRVAALSRSLPDGANEMGWSASWRVGQVHYELNATVDDAGRVSYAQSTYETRKTDQGDVETDPVSRPTTGSLFEGPDGVVRIDVARDGRIAEGVLLEDARGGSYGKRSTGTPVGDSSVIFDGDAAPDNGVSGTFRVASCEQIAAGSAAGEAAPAPGAVPATPARPAPNQRRLALAVRTGVISARRAAKRHFVDIAVASTQRITDLRVELLRGKRLVGGAQLGSVDGPHYLRIRVGRRLRAGIYQLRFTGREADGVLRERTLRVRVRR